jgi:hypothetical protein
LQTKIVDYDYAVNDYYGNEQSRQEHVEPGKQVGYWNARMADGAIHSVNYVANDYGNLAHVVVRQNNYATPAYSAPVQTYAAPVQTYAAPSYSAPAETYAAPSYSAPAYSAAHTYIAPKMHYNYEEQNIYVPQTYAAPQTYSAPQVYSAPHDKYAMSTY